MGRDLIRLQILMDYSEPITGTPGQKTSGLAAVRWSILDPSVPQETIEVYRAALITALYAEVLVIDADSRTELSARVDGAVKRWKLSGVKPERLDFDPWSINVSGMGSVPLWPWRMMSPQSFEARVKFTRMAVGNPKTYTATLKADRPSRSHPAGLWAFTEMPLGLGKVCVPSSPLIAAHAYGKEMIEAGRHDAVAPLCFLLEQVNRYYRALGKFPLGRQALALSEALAALEAAGRGTATKRESPPRGVAFAIETIIKKEEVERIFALNRAGWEGYAKKMGLPEGWSGELQPHDSGTGVAAFDRESGTGLGIQPLYHDDVSSPTMLIVSNYCPPGRHCGFGSTEFENALRATVEKDLGSRYSVRIVAKRAAKFEVVEMLISRVTPGGG